MKEQRSILEIGRAVVWIRAHHALPALLATRMLEYGFGRRNEGAHRLHKTHA